PCSTKGLGQFVSLTPRTPPAPLPSVTPRPAIWAVDPARPQRATHDHSVNGYGLSSPGVEPGQRPSEGRVPPSHSEDVSIPTRNPTEIRALGKPDVRPLHHRDAIGECGPLWWYDAGE